MEKPRKHRLVVPALLVIAAGQPFSLFAQEASPPASPAPAPAPAEGVPQAQPAPTPPASEQVPPAPPPAAPAPQPPADQPAAPPAKPPEPQAQPPAPEPAATQPAQPATPPPQPPPAQPAAPAPQPPAQPPAPPKLLFSFQNAPYEQVMDFMARQTGLPVIREADLPNAPVTFISATEYTLEEALDVLNRMLFMHALQVRRDENFLLVTKIENMAPFGPVGQDAVPAAGASQIVTVVVPLLNAAAAPLADQLKPLVTRFGAITALPAQNALVIVDTAAQCARLRDVVKMLDAERPSDAQYRLFLLKHAKAETVFGALKGLMAEKRTFQIVEKDGSIKTVRDEQIQGLNIAPYQPSNAIVAIGPEGRLQTIEEIVAMLDQPASGSDRAIMTFALAGAAPDDAAGRLTSLFASVLAEQKPTILPLKEQGKVTVVGSPDQLTQAAALIGEMDPGAEPTGAAAPGAPAPARPESRASLIRLKHVTPQNAQAILTRLLSPRQTAVLRYAPAPDDKGLIVSGSAPDVEAMEQLIAGLDVAPQVDSEVRQVVIGAGDPEKVLAKAVELYGLSSRGQLQPVTATLDKPSRTATLVGGRAALQAFTDLLKSTEGTVATSREVRTFDLARGKPSTVAPKLLRLAEPMLKPADGAAYVAPQVEAMDEVNKLVVRAQPEQFAIIEQLLRSIDTPDAGRLSFRVVHVAGGDPKATAERALAVYTQQTEGLPEDQAGKVSFEIDSLSGGLLITASSAGMERYVRILEEMQKHAGPSRELRMVELRHAKAADVVGFLMDLIRSSKPFVDLGGVEPVIEPIEATNSLLVAAQPGQFAVIEALVKNLDTRSASERPPLRILRLRTTEAASIAQVLNQSYSQRSVDQRAKLPVDITADASTNTLIVSAHPDVMPEIERIVSELNETQAADASGREIRIFPLKVARAEELGQTIDQMYPMPPMPRDRFGNPRPDLQQPKEVSVRADRATNSLIVDAPAQRMAGFEQLVKQLDQQKLAENVELRTYRVQRADLGSMATTLRASASSGSLTGGRPPTAGVSATISIETEPMSRTLIVSGPSEIFPQVEKVLAQLDAAPERPTTSVKMYALQHARAERLQSLLSRLLLARLKEQQETQGRTVADVQSLLDVAADNATNTLIISAPEAIQQIGGELIKSLDTPAAQVGRPVVRVLPMVYADANQAAQTLNGALQTMELPSGGRVTVIATAGSNALLLSGAEADLAKVEELVKSLDVRPLSEDTVSIQTFKLEHADAQSIAQMVQTLLVEQQQTDPRILRMQMQYNRGQLPRIPQVKVEADARTNSLVVSGPPAVIELAKTVIERVDQPAGETGRTAATFTPVKADPAALVRTAQPIVAATVPSGRKPVELVAEPSTRSVVVIGTPEQVAAAVKTLAEFDDRAVAVPAVSLRVFDLTAADASAVASSVQGMLGDRSRWPEALRAAEKAGLGVPSPTVNADRQANRLIVSAPTELMALARELIATLDRKREGAMVDVKVFPLAKGKADSVAAALRTVLTADPLPGEPAPVVTPEPGSNSVVVAAAPERLSKAVELVKSLDESAQPEGRAVRTVYLKHARAEAITPVVESLLARQSVVAMLPEWQRGQYLAQRGPEDAGIKVAAEKRLNAVVVTGPIGLIEIAEQIITELDAAPSGEGLKQRSVRIITLDNSDATEMSASIDALFKDDTSGEPLPVVRVDKASNSLIVRASAGQMETITGLVETLDRATIAASREMRLIPINRSRADAAMMAQALQRLLEQRGGTKVEIIPVDQLMTPPPPQSAPPAGDTEPKDKRGTDASDWLAPFPMAAPRGIPAMLELARVAAALGLVMPDDDDQPPQGPGPGQPAPPAPPEEDAGTVTIAVDPATNSLIVVGSTRAANRIAQLAAELERQMPAEPTRLRVISLPEAVDVQSVATLVAQTVVQVGQVGPANPGGFTGRVSVQPDPAGDAVIVSANDTDFETLREMIAAVARPGPVASVTVKIYPLSTVSASAARTAIADLLSARPRGPQAQRLRTQDITLQDPAGEIRGTVDPALVRITADPGGTALIIAAPPAALPLLDRFIAMIDQSPVTGRMAIRQYPLKNSQAVDAAKTLQGVFDAARQAPGAQELPAARFVADERTNTLLVTATDGQLKELDRILVSLDAPVEDEKSEVAIIPLQLARPSTVKQILETVVIGRDAGRKERVRISASDDSNLFVMRGTKEEIEEARKIVAEVDKSETTGLPIRSIKLERADAQTVATGLQKFFEDRARASTRAGMRAQARQVAIVGDRRTQTLVVAAADEDFEQIKSMMATFDAPAKARDMQFRVIPLEHARVSEIREAIENMVNQVTWEPFVWWSPWGGGGRQDESPKDKLVVEFNERANAVIVMGQGESFETVERIVKALDTPAPAGTALALRAVKVKNADASRVAAAVQAAMTTPGWPRWRGPDPDGVRAEADEDSGTIVLIGRKDRIDEAAAQIAKLDEVAAPTGQQIESITLKFARADQIAESLRRFFADRARAGGGTSGVSILGSRDGNVLIAQSSPEDMEVLKDLVSQMDQPEEGEGRVRELYKLRNAQASELANVLREQFPRSQAGREGLVIVTPQPSTGSVIVSAPQELFPKVDALVKELDAPPTTEGTKIVTATLANSRADDVAASLKQALPEAVKVTITPVRRTNSILLTGSDEAVALVMEQIRKLDEQAFTSPTEFRRIRLEHEDAFDAAFTIRGLLNRRQYAPGEPQPAVSSASDNTLVVSASKDQIEEIIGIIKQIDVPRATTRTTEFVPLKHADAEATATALEVFYGPYAPEAATAAARSVTIIANPLSRSLVISADEGEWEKLRALIEKLDNEQYDTSRRVEIIALKHADATSLARTLNEAFQSPLRAEQERERARQQRQPQGGRREEQGAGLELPTVLVDTEKAVTVAAEPLTNSLVVSAAREDAERIRNLVTQLDVPEFSRLPEARIIPLRIGPASGIANSLRQMFLTQGVGPGGGATARTGPRSVVIVGEDRSNTLIVRADESQFVQIKALAEMLQQEGDRSRAFVRVLRLANVPAARVATSLRTTFTPVAQERGEVMAVEVDRTTNSLVVTSSEKLFEQIKAVALELDGAMAPAPEQPGATVPAGLGRSVFIIDVENNSPAEVKKMLEEMGLTRPQQGDGPGVVSEPISIVPLTTRRSIAVVASPKDGEAVVALVRSLDAAPAYAEQRVAMIRLKTANASAVATALESLLKPAAADGKTAPAAGLAEQIRRLSVQRDGAAQADLALDLSKPIRVQAEPQSNSILVSSTAGNVDALRGVIELLDRLPLGDAVTVRFFPLENAAATRVATVVEKLFAAGDILRQIPATNIKGEPLTEVGKALSTKIAVSVDDRTNSIIVAGREEAVALVEVLIKQLDGEAAANWVEPAIVPLQHADASRLATTIKQALTPGAPTSPEAEALQRQVARLRMLEAGKDPMDPASRAEADLFTPLSSLVVIPDTQTNSLIVVASPANLKVVTSMVKMLDVPLAAAANTVRIFPLQFAAADRVGDMLRQIFTQQLQAGVIRTEDDIFVAPDVRTNSLVVTTSQRSFLVIESLLARLDGAEMRPLVGVHVIPVPKGNVQTLAPRIESLMRERIQSARRSGGVASPLDTFSVQAEPATNSLIVAASDENLKIIQQLVEVLTRGAEALAGAGVVDVIPVTNGRAEQLMSALRELYIDKENKLRGEGAVRVTADPRLNALVVSGTAADVEAVRGIVSRLDAIEVSAVTEYRRIELKKAEAAEVVRLLKSVLAGRPLSGRGATGVDGRQTILRFMRQQQADAIEREQGREATEAEISGALLEQVQLDSENRTNSVVVVAPARLMVLIESMIQDLDTTVAGARTIEVFKLKNADARAMADVLRNLFNLRQEGENLVLVPEREEQLPGGAVGPPDEGVLGGRLYPIPDPRQALSITIDARTNRLLVSATEEYLEQVRMVVEELDSVEINEREQVTYELRNAKASDVAKILRDFFKGEVDTLRTTLGAERAGSILSLLEREITVQGDEKSNRLLVGVSPRYKESFDTIVRELDSTPPQVMIQVLLAEVTLDAGKVWGADLSVGPFGGDDYRVSTLAAATGVTAALGVPNLSISSMDFELLIRSLEVQGRLEVLSRPQILVKNNETAKMQVGEKIQVADQSVLSSGILQTTTRQEDVGIILNVTPSISADGFVSMDLEPEISALTQRTTQISEDFNAPIISIRNVQTSVMVKDGETVVIGGLIQTTEEQRKTKIPILGDIPLAGALFRSSSFNQVKTELLVILTPKVIRSGQEAAIEELRKLTSEEIRRLSEPQRLKDFLDPAVKLFPPEPAPASGPIEAPPEEAPVPAPEPPPAPAADEPLPGPFDPSRPPPPSLR